MASVYSRADPGGVCAIADNQEHILVASLFGYFDESGKFQDHKIVCFCGFVDRLEQMRDFGREWGYWLRRSGLKSLHAVKALRFQSPLSSRMKAIGVNARSEAIRPFIRQSHSLELGVRVVVDVAPFNRASQASPAIKSFFHGDPHYLAFAKAIYEILDHFPNPLDTLSVICDDDQSTAMNCYSLLNKLKLRDSRVKKRVVSICFGNDQEYPSIQASDLCASLTRQEAYRRFYGTPFPLLDLYRDLVSAGPGNRLQWKGGFWDKNAIASLEAAATMKNLQTVSFAE